MSYKSHLFICTNKPDKPGKCGYEGSDDLRAKMKERCREAFGKDVRVSSSGCMGMCEHGIVAVVYPQGKWLLDLQKKDDDIVFDAVAESMKGH
jgi:(2Fe-2S) ferredoxin